MDIPERRGEGRNGTECGKRGMNREGENYFYMKPMLYKKNQNI